LTKTQKEDFGMFKEFKQFAMRGNMVDLAVAFIIGAAFGKIITSLITDVIMPPIGMLLGKVNFADMYINLTKTPYKSLADAKAAGAPVISYGMFLNDVLDFVVVAFVVFLIVRSINKFKKEETATTKACGYCLSTIPLEATRCPHCTSELPSA
jgi:large conductance mechanosensitive channel